THRCRQLLEALTGAEPSIGFVHGLLARTAKVLREADRRIRTLITLLTVLGFVLWVRSAKIRMNII
ncbi:MAG: hypothetical protein ACXWUK_14790, partial [Burkholderiales bacterium]